MRGALLLEKHVACARLGQGQFLCKHQLAAAPPCSSGEQQHRSLPCAEPRLGFPEDHTGLFSRYLLGVHFPLRTGPWFRACSPPRSPLYIKFLAI